MSSKAAQGPILGNGKRRLVVGLKYANDLVAAHAWRNEFLKPAWIRETDAHRQRRFALTRVRSMKPSSSPMEQGVRSRVFMHTHEVNLLSFVMPADLLDHPADTRVPTLLFSPPSSWEDHNAPALLQMTNSF